MRKPIFALTFLLAYAVSATFAVAQDAPRILFLSKSAGFQHSSIKEKDGKLNHVATVLTELAEANGAELVATKDASLINAENLKNYNLVIFYTTGFLTETGADGQPAMGENGVKELSEWIEAGGGFMGFHCATDTFHTGKQEAPTEYTKMIGASFLTHGAQFEGTLRLVDSSHPVAFNIEDGWTKKDEWYMFRNINTENIHVVALLDPGAEREKQKRYDVPNYPVIWTSAPGDGRVYYNAMGHREDVWDDATFQAMVVDAAGWALGNGETDSEPNYADVVPKTKK